MNKTFYICKYTPVELLAACSGECEVFDTVHGSFEKAESAAHPNICGFGKSLLESALNGEIKELVLVNCCDTIKSVYEILEQSGKLDEKVIVCDEAQICGALGAALFAAEG